MEKVVAGGYVEEREDQDGRADSEGAVEAERQRLANVQVEGQLGSQRQGQGQPREARERQGRSQRGKKKAKKGRRKREQVEFVVPPISAFLRSSPKIVRVRRVLRASLVQQPTRPKANSSARDRLGAASPRKKRLRPTNSRRVEKGGTDPGAYEKRGARANGEKREPKGEKEKKKKPKREERGKQVPQTDTKRLSRQERGKMEKEREKRKKMEKTAKVLDTASETKKSRHVEEERRRKTREVKVLVFRNGEQFNNGAGVELSLSAQTPWRSILAKCGTAVGVEDKMKLFELGGKPLRLRDLIELLDSAKDSFVPRLVITGGERYTGPVVLG